MLSYDPQPPAVKMTLMSMKSFGRLVLIAAISCSLLEARSHKRKPAAGGAPGDFSYYLLSLSWAPDFCAQPNVPKNDRECGAGRHVGFVVHGLWPQGENSRGPERCRSASPVAQEIVQRMLAYIPSEGLIQHEWTNHGTCTGLNAAQYFENVRKAFDSVLIPAQYNNLSRQIQVSPADLESKFAAANPSFPRTAFRVSCHGSELQELRICFSKDLKPRACTDSAGECRLGSIAMRPVR